MCDLINAQADCAQADDEKLRAMLADLDDLELPPEEPAPIIEAVEPCAKSRIAPIPPAPKPIIKCAKSRTETPAEKCKVAKSASRQSTTRDTNFLRITKPFASVAVAAEIDLSSGISLSPFLPSSPSKPSTTGAYKLRTKIDLKKSSAPSDHGLPLPWRDTGELLTIGYLARSFPLVDCRKVWIFTLRLAPTIHEQSLNPLKTIRDRLRIALKKHLGRNVTFMAVAHIKTPSGDELHAHGIVALNECEIPAATVAFMEAGGPWRSGAGAARQIKIEEPIEALGGAEGWVCQYGAQRERWPTKEYLAAHFRRVRVKIKRDPVIFICSKNPDRSQDLRSTAEALYKEHRTVVLAAIMAAKGAKGAEAETVAPRPIDAPAAFPAPARAIKEMKLTTPADNDDFELDQDIADLLRKLETDDAPETNQQRRDRLSCGPAWRERSSFDYEAPNDGGVEIHIAGGANNHINAQLHAMLSACQ